MRFVGVASLAAVLLAVPAAPAQDPKQSITVQGDGVIDAPPDLFILYVGVYERDPDVAAARLAVAARARQVVKAARAFPIDRARTYTSSNTIVPAYEGRRLVGYDVTQMMKLTLSDVRQAEEFAVTVIKSGANVVNSMEFTVKNLSELQDQARQKAVENALERARGMAKVLQYAPDRPVAITMLDGSYVLLGCRWDNVPLEAGGGALREEDRLHLIPPANAKIQARVQVQFSLKPLGG